MSVIMPSMKNNELADNDGYIKMLIQLMAEKGVIKKSQVEKGLSKLLNHSIENDFAPPPARFVSWCLPDCDLPSPEQAYQHACQSNWSHKAIYEAVKLVGFYEFKSGYERDTRRIFTKCYKSICDDIREGKQYPDLLKLESR